MDAGLLFTPCAMIIQVCAFLKTLRVHSYDDDCISDSLEKLHLNRESGSHCLRRVRGCLISDIGRVGGRALSTRSVGFSGACRWMGMFC